MIPLLLLYLIAYTTAHTCIHDHIQSKSPEISLDDNPLRFTYKRGLNSVRPDHDPIRIVIVEDLLLNDPYTCYREGDVVTVSDGEGGTRSFQCTDDDVLTASKKDYLVNTLMKEAKDYFEGVLRVIPGTGNLRIGVSSCGGFPLSVPVPSRFNTGVSNADFVLFVTARPILGSNAIAFASSCTANGLGRPTAGHANFNVSNLVDFEGDRPRQLGIAIHEITHALGFSASRFGTFIRWLDDGSYQRMDSNDINRLVIKPGYSHYRIITDAVRDAVRIHYGCSSLQGADIEDGGASGTAGSHWEKRVFMTEYMTGTANSFPEYSNITLALLYDSGWYEVDWNKAGEFTWGRDAGCDFVEGTCVDDGWEGYKCDDGLGELSTFVPVNKCTRDRRGYGPCNLQTFGSALPQQWQYFSDPNVGGHSVIADYCTYTLPLVTCTLGAEDLTSALDLDLSSVASTGQSFEYNSRCFESSLLKLQTAFRLDNFLVNDVIQTVPEPRCYNTTCVGPTDLRIQVDGVWLKCETDGGEIPTTDIPTYGGTIVCPPASEICSEATRDRSWPEFEDIEPKEGGASTLVTITGKNFLETELIEVTVEGPCTNIEIISDEELTCTIPDSDYFIGITDLSFFQTKKNVIIKDARGYTSQGIGTFRIQIPLDEIYLASLLKWMGENPLWAVIACAIGFGPFIIIIYCGCKACQKPKKPSKNKDDFVHKEDYYDDDFGVDDYYD